MYKIISACCVLVLLTCACNSPRIKERNDWGRYYEAYGIKNACFILRDNNHESVHYYNMGRCTRRLTPASTFKIFSSLIALETAVAPDDQLVIKWDGIQRRPEWDKDLTMREAFTVSSEPYYRELARRIGKERMKYYLDTVKYGNMKIGGAIDTFWLDNSLQISADEQAGLVKKLYFNELPAFSERSQRIVRSMMLHEETPDYRLYYKTGWGADINNKHTLWIVGFAERIEKIKEPKSSMNKSDERVYPYFFAQNFDVATNDTTKDWLNIRVNLVKQVLRDYGAIPGGKG